MRTFSIPPRIDSLERNGLHLLAPIPIRKAKEAMVSVPLAVFAVLILAMFLAGLFFINVIIGNYLLALICILAICGLGLAVGMLVGCNGTRLDGIGHRLGKGGLDLSEDALRGLKEIPEGTIVATVPPAFDNGIAGKVIPTPESAADTGDGEEPPEENGDGSGDDATARAKHLDDILPTIDWDDAGNGEDVDDASEGEAGDDDETADETAECDTPAAAPAEEGDDADDVANDDPDAKLGAAATPSEDEEVAPAEDGEESSPECPDETVREDEADADGSPEKEEASGLGGEE